ncbi:MAG: hypothetical protein ACYDEV_00175 [Acidiferrobacter sp.]
MRPFLIRLFRKRYPEELWLPAWCLKTIEVFWAVDFFAVGVRHDMKSFRRNARLYIDRAGYLLTVSILAAFMARYFGTPTDYRISLGFFALATWLFLATAIKAISLMRTPAETGAPRA